MSGFLAAIWLPFPPSINNYYVQTRNGRFISKKGKEFREQVITECIIQGISGIKYAGKVEFSVVLYPPDRRKRDLDNYKKALLDAITHSGVWVDDSQIDQIHSYRGTVRKGGAAVVRIEDAGMIVPWGHEHIVFE